MAVWYGDWSEVVEKDSVLYAQMVLTAEEPLYSPASESALSSKLIMSPPSMQLQRKTGSRPIPWDVSLSLGGSTHSTDWTLEWQALQILTEFAVSNTPKLLAYDERSIATRQVREAAGETHRVRTILVTQPVADSTLRKKGLQIGLRQLVDVLKDVVNAHEAAWKTAKIAHCDISPGNIRIHQERGILADWEFAVSVDEFHTAKAIN